VGGSCGDCTFNNAPVTIMPPQKVTESCQEGKRAAIRSSPMAEFRLNVLHTISVPGVVWL
jgi:hypothetical protein